MMSRSTGLAVDAEAHIRQSVADILTTPIGTRVMRRHYGSLLPELQDRPLNEHVKLQYIAATAHALVEFEPRIDMIGAVIEISASTAGQFDLVIETRNGAAWELTL